MIYEIDLYKIRGLLYGNLSETSKTVQCFNYISNLLWSPGLNVQTWKGKKKVKGWTRPGFTTGRRGSSDKVWRCISVPEIFHNIWQRMWSTYHTWSPYNSIQLHKITKIRHLERRYRKVKDSNDKSGSNINNLSSLSLSVRHTSVAGLAGGAVWEGLWECL